LAGIRKTAGKEGQSMEKLQIVYLPPGELKPYEKNARRHSPEDVEAIKKSILEDGWGSPIEIWSDENIIVAGHGRQLAAMELGLEEVPCIRLDWMTDKQRREYAIRSNRTAELSAWDFSKLDEELAALAIDGQDFPELNFSRPDLDSLDDLFSPVEAQGEKEKKQIKCPHCGEWFTP
jgi:ParB-like chromosome segregation protein Spo0J